MSTKPYRIDVHHHILPPEYVKALDSIGASNSGGASLPSWNAEAAIALMDRQGIATAITSISSPGVYFGNRTFARDLARRCNEFSAKLLSDYPQRFGAIALLPLPDVEAALQEIAYALDTLKLDGAILQASVGDQYLGDPAFDEVFAELNKRKATVLLHPTTPPGSDVPKLNLPPFIVEFVFDTTRAVANLIYNGTLERYSDISIILAHAGGTVPYLAGRFAMASDIMPELGRHAPQGAIAYLKRLYYDTAIAATPEAMRSLQEIVGAGQILFGSDYPYLEEHLIEKTVLGLGSYDGFDDRDRACIERDNALRLFPSVAERVGKEG